MYLYVASIHIIAECRWDQVPQDKTQLIAVYNRTVVQHPTIYHVSIYLVCLTRLLLTLIPCSRRNKTSYCLTKQIT